MDFQSNGNLKTANNTKILIDKILSDPISFKPARHAETSNMKPSSYIRISNSRKSLTSSRNDSPFSSSNGAKSGSPSAISEHKLSPKPKSVAAAIAAYTGKKYLTKAEKKLQKKLEKEQKLKNATSKSFKSQNSPAFSPVAAGDDEDFGEEIGEEFGEEVGKEVSADGANDNVDSSSAVQFSSSDEDNDDEYQSAVDEVVGEDDQESDVGSGLSAKAGSTEKETKSVAKKRATLLPQAGEKRVKKPKLDEGSAKNENEIDGVEKGEEDDDDEDDDDDDEDYNSEDESEDEESEESEVSDVDEKTLNSKADRSFDDSVDESQHKRINDKIELKQLANKDSKPTVTSERRPESNVTAAKKSRSASPNESQQSTTQSSSTSLAGVEDNEFLYGQNLDFSDSDFYQLEEDSQDRGSNQSKKIWKNWQKEYIFSKPVGLLNLGVTCYTNAAVQAMIHIPAIQHYLKDVNDHKYDQLINPGSVTSILSLISSKMWKTKQQQQQGQGARYINPKKLIKKLDDINCMMSEWQQEDSHEYFMSLLSKLQEDSTPKKQKLNTSIIYDIFGGVLNQAVVCQNCNLVSKTQQEFYDLSLSLDPKKKRKITPSSMNSSRVNSKEPSPERQSPSFSQSDPSESAIGTPKDEQATIEVAKQKPLRYSVINAINDFFEPEIIKTDKADKSAGYACTKCKQTTIAHKFSSIARAPETLVIHIKRFRFNESNNSSSKLKSPVSYPLILDLANFENEDLAAFEKKNPSKVTSTASSPDTVDSKGADPIRYQLISVVVHEGRSISSGHYIAHCRQPSGEWYTYDDEYINKVSEAQVLKEPNAYYLVYTRLKYKGEGENKGKTASVGGNGQKEGAKRDKKRSKSEGPVNGKKRSKPN